MFHVKLSSLVTSWLLLKIEIRSLSLVKVSYCTCIGKTFPFMVYKEYGLIGVKRPSRNITAITGR